MIDRCRNSFESLEPALITKAFEICGVSRPLKELHNKDFLTAIFDDYFLMLQTTVEEEHNDPKENELKEIVNDQELDFDL